MTPDDVVARIDPQEVIDLALALGNIDSPTGSEGPAGEFVRDWLAAQGFRPRTFALTEDRINVAAWIEMHKQRRNAAFTLLLGYLY